MFKGWLKSRYSNNELERWYRTLSYIWRNWYVLYFTSGIPKYNTFKLFRYFICRFNNHFCILGETSKFFRKYKKHSKDVARILKKGYCNESFLGSINDFKIVYPQEPDIEDIGIAKLHLEKDYNDIWKLKNECIDISEKYLLKIENITKEFEIETNRIIKEKINFEQRSGEDNNLNVVCLYPSIVLEVFNKIRYQDKNIKLKISSLYDNFPDVKYNITFDNGFEKLFRLKCESNDFNNNFNILQQCMVELTNNETLRELVNNYENEYGSFYSNEKRTKFFNVIDNLYKQIVNQNKSMNKKVNCGEDGCVNKFMNFLAVFPR